MRSFFCRSLPLFLATTKLAAVGSSARCEQAPSPINLIHTSNMADFQVRLENAPIHAASVGFERKDVRLEGPLPRMQVNLEIQEASVGTWIAAAASKGRRVAPKPAKQDNL